MKKKRKSKKKLPINKKKAKSLSIIPFLFAIAFLSLFSEAMRTIPAGAKSDNFSYIPFELPKLNSNILEKNLLNNVSLINEKINYENSKKDIFLIEDNFSIDKELFVAKVPEEKKQNIKLKAPIPRIVDVPKVEETIKVAAEKISAKTIIVDGEEKLIPGSSDKNITYMQILLKPNDLELNLKYAQQQGKMGNYKQTISTLERLNMLYPDNVEIKLYLL